MTEERTQPKHGEESRKARTQRPSSPVTTRLGEVMPRDLLEHLRATLPPQVQTEG